MSPTGDRWSMPSPTDAELARREDAERRRGVLRRLGLLSEEGITIRRPLSEVEIVSARMAGIEVTRDGRVIS